MTEINVANLVVSGVLGLMWYSVKLNLSGAERRVKVLEDNSVLHSGHINGILVALAATSAKQEELARCIDSLTRSLDSNTRSMNDLSHKLTEVSIRSELT